MTNGLLMAGFFGALYVVLGWVAEGVVRIMPLRWEQSLALPKVFTSTTNGNVPQSLNAVFQKICQAADPEFPPRLRVLDSDDANAFALPGGFVLITRGLLEKMESEEELAFVLGHELAHLHGRDHLKHASRRLVFGLAIGLLFGHDTLSGMINQIDELQQLHYSRAQEMKADHLGLLYLNKAYGHVAGAEFFFEKLQREGWAPRMLSTHPLANQRTAALHRWIRQDGFAENQVTPWVWKKAGQDGEERERIAD